MSNYLKSQNEVKLSNRMARCGLYLVFNHYFTVDELRLIAADFCFKPLLCPFCAMRRGAKCNGLRFEPRFTNLNDQLQNLYCADDPALYEKCLIRPMGQIDRQVIASEKSHLNQIVATLGLKEMTQGTLIRKFCTYTPLNQTRSALFELDKLIRSIYMVE